MAYHADNALPSHSEGERVLPMQKGGKQRLKKSDIWVTGSFDVPFLALSLLLLTIGLVMLFSASYAYAFYNDDGNSYAYISRQLIFAVVGLVAMFILSKLNYKVIQAATVPLLLVTLALLCLVLVYHTNLRGFRRWIPLGPITFQPSDLAKFTISVVLANYISRYYHQMRKFKYGFVYPILVIAVFCGLIYLEHHMSCTILIFLIGASLMWAGGSNWKLFAIGVGIVAAVAVLVVVFMVFITRRTVFGYESKMGGFNPSFALYGGTKQVKVMLITMALAGAIASMAGSAEVFGLKYRYADGMLSSTSYAWTGLQAALIAGLDPVGMFFVSIFLSGLQIGGSAIQRSLGIPLEIATIIQCCITLFVSVKIVIRFKKPKTAKKGGEPA